MQQQKSKKILFYIFLLITFGSINNLSFNEIRLDKIENIKISGLKNYESKILLNDIRELNLKSIFFLKAKEISKIINKNNIIENFEIFKKYPSTLFIEIEQTKFLAKINKNGKTFIVGSNGKLLEEKYSSQPLPYIFGNPNIENFIHFKKILDSSRFSYDTIKNLYYFPSMRWDIELKNNIILKLSNENLKETLENAYEFLSSEKNRKIKILDMRVKNQIIIND
tara:strand:- start:426 stop:1097 length:672 start_codon:yes stop_codon:yes gene_type:complete